MSVNLYGNIGTTYSGIVTGAELERVSQEIFGGAQVKAAEKTQTSTQQVQPQQQTTQTEVSMYNRNVDITLTQQLSQAKTDFNVQLSPQAMQNIEALKSMAAMQQQSVHKLSEGKIQLPVDNSPKSDIETVFAVPHATTIIKSFSLDKDKRGSNPFAYTNFSSGNQEENAEGGTSTTSTSGATFSIVA